MLQWGHASSRVETDPYLSLSKDKKLLQWGHASSRVETCRWATRTEQANNASMGPRVFTRGNAKRLAIAHPSKRCFNGATRLHAWKRDRGDSDSRRASASMGPRVFTRGNGLNSEEWLEESSFNGATRLHAWKRHCGRHSASSIKGFNGATRLHAWKHECDDSKHKRLNALQWGHASSRVETDRQAA